MSQSEAITAHREHIASSANLLERIDHLRQARDRLSAQLAQHEERSTIAEAECKAANAALSVAITLQALGDGSADAIDAARSRVNRAAVAQSALASGVAEVEALKASISDVDKQLIALAQRVQAMQAQANALAGQRLREKAADLYARQRAVVETLAAMVAEGRALHAVAQRIESPGNFATPYLFAQSIIVEALGGGDRIVVGLEDLVRPAIDALTTTLQAEGFNV